MEMTRDQVLEGHPVQATADIVAPPLTIEQQQFQMARRLRVIEYWMRVASPPARWSVRRFAIEFTCLHGFRPDSIPHRAWMLREERLARQALLAALATGGTASTMVH